MKRNILWHYKDGIAGGTTVISSVFCEECVWRVSIRSAENQRNN